MALPTGLPHSGSIRRSRPNRASRSHHGSERRSYDKGNRMPRLERRHYDGPSPVDQCAYPDAAKTFPLHDRNIMIILQRLTRSRKTETLVNLCMAGTLIVTLTAVGACAYRPGDVADPKRISIAEAFVGVEDGIRQFQARLAEDQIVLGMIPCKINIVFNISAKANDQQAVSLSLDGASLGVPIKGEVGDTNTAESNRGNQVTVEYDGIACLPKDSLGATKPTNVGALDEQLNRLGGQRTHRGGPTLAPRPRGP